MLVLPTLFDGTANYSITVQLDNSTFILEFNWNDRQNSWFFNLLDVNSNPLLMGRKIVLNLFMLREFVGPQYPTGDLYAIDNGLAQQPPGLTDLGARVLLYYFSAADISALQAQLNA